MHSSVRGNLLDAQMTYPNPRLMPSTNPFRKAAQLLALLLAAMSCQSAPLAKTTSDAGDAASAPRSGRPAVIGLNEGEQRLLRGVAPLFIKIDPITTGSTRMVLGSSDLPPGDSIAVHRHLQEDEIIIIHRGTARVQLGREQYTATAGGAVYIPQGTCVTVVNIGRDTLVNFFIFSSPGFEQVLRAVSSGVGEPKKIITPADRATAFHRGHAVAGPSGC